MAELKIKKTTGSIVAPLVISFMFTLGLLLLGAACQRTTTTQVSGNSNTNTSQDTELEPQLPQGFVRVYLRSTPVNLADKRFEQRSATGGLILKHAWYDPAQKFLVVGTTKSYWQYCNVGADTWATYSITASFDSLVTSDFKRQHLCTKDNVPLYAEDATVAGLTAATDGSQIIQLRKVYVDELCDLKEYCETENESGEEEDVYVYETDGDHQLGIGEDDVAVEIYVR